MLRSIFSVAFMIFFALSSFAQDRKALIEKANSLYNAKDYKNSYDVYQQAFKLDIGNSTEHYNAACSAALAGDKKNAFADLKIAVRQETLDPEHLIADNDLLSLHNEKDWDLLLKSPFIEYKLLEISGKKKYDNSRYDIAMEDWLKALAIADTNELIRSKVEIYLDLAFLFQILGKKEKEFEYYELGIAEAKKSKNKNLILNTLGVGSSLYFNLEDYDRSLELLNEKVKFDPTVVNTASYLADLGDIYRNKNNFNEADKYYLRAIKIAESKKDSTDLMILYHNYATIPFAQRKFKIAVEYCKKARTIALTNKSDYFLQDCNLQLAKSYNELMDFPNALIYIDEQIKYYKENANYGELSSLYNFKSDVFFATGRFKEAYQLLHESNVLRDSVKNNEVQNKLSELESSILEEKKDKEIKLINKEKELQAAIHDEENKRQKIFVFIAIGVLLIIIVFSALLYKRYRLTKDQKNIIEEKNKEVEEKNKDILDSIRYARRIQRSLLPTEKYIDKNLKRLQNN